MTKHLTEARRLIEIVMASYSMGFGLFIIWALVGSAEPLYWINVSPQTQGDVALIVLLFGVVHAFGIRINGAWKYSPMLRFMGMAGHGAVVSYIAAAAAVATIGSPHGIASGVYTYTATAGIFWMLALGTLKDMRRHWQIWSVFNG